METKKERANWLVGLGAVKARQAVCVCHFIVWVVGDFHLEGVAPRAYWQNLYGIY